MKITDEAVEAAARVNYSGDWDSLYVGSKKVRRSIARMHLEAAAPHMLAEAKATALEELAADVSLRIDQIEAHHVPESEYGTLLAQREEADSIYRDILARAATYRPTP